MNLEFGKSKNLTKITYNGVLFSIERTTLFSENIVIVCFAYFNWLKS